MRAHVKKTVRAIERDANTRLIAKIAYRDFGRTTLAHGLDPIFVFTRPRTAAPTLASSGTTSPANLRAAPTATTLEALLTMRLFLIHRGES
jgi:hypothetical protein